METSATEFVSEMVSLGVELHVVAQAVEPGFSLAPVHCLSRGGVGRAGRYRHFVTEADRFIGSGDWAVVHAVTPCWNCNLYQPRSGTAREQLARAVASRRGVLGKLLRHLAAPFNRKEQLLTRLERQLLRRPTPPRVAALSSYMRRQLLDAYELPAETVREVFNGVTVELPAPAERAEIRRSIRAEMGVAAAQLVVIFAGHNFRRKGLARALEALRQPEAAEWHLWVAGKDSPDWYWRHAGKLGVDGRVRFLGARSDVRRLYLAADAGILPTYYDPCSRMVLEAMSLGLPCITTRYDGSADCIEEGRNGFVVDSPEETGAMARVLGRLSDPACRSALSENALQLRARLSMRRHAREVAALYEEIVSERRVAPG